MRVFILQTMACGLWNLLCTHKVCNLFGGVLWLGVLYLTCLLAFYQNKNPAYFENIKAFFVYHCPRISYTTTTTCTVMLHNDQPKVILFQISHYGKHCSPHTTCFVVLLRKMISNKKQAYQALACTALLCFQASNVQFQAHISVNKAKILNYKFKNNSSAAQCSMP